MNNQPTILDHIIALLHEGYTPEQAALKLCERLNNYIPFKQFRKQATDLAAVYESYPHDPKMSGDENYVPRGKPKGKPFIKDKSKEKDNPSKGGDETNESARSWDPDHSSHILNGTRPDGSSKGRVPSKEEKSKIDKAMKKRREDFKKTYEEELIDEGPIYKPKSSAKRLDNFLGGNKRRAAIENKAKKAFHGEPGEKRDLKPTDRRHLTRMNSANQTYMRGTKASSTAKALRAHDQHNEIRRKYGLPYNKEINWE